MTTSTFASLIPGCYTNFGVFLGYVSGKAELHLEFEDLRGQRVIITESQKFMNDFPWNTVDFLQEISKKEWEEMVKQDKEMLARTSA